MGIELPREGARLLLLPTSGQEKPWGVSLRLPLLSIGRKERQWGGQTRLTYLCYPLAGLAQAGEAVGEVIPLLALLPPHPGEILSYRPDR